MMNASTLGSEAGPGKGDYTTGASYGGSGGRNVDDAFSYAKSREDIIGDPLNE